MKKIFATILAIFTIACMACGFNIVAYADTVDELKNKISEKGSAIEELEEEIDTYNREIVKTQAKSQTLSRAIWELDLTRKKLLTDMAVTDNKIDTANYTIEKIQVEINGTVRGIQLGNNTIASLMRDIDEIETRSLVEVILSKDELSKVWGEIDNLQQFRSVISEELIELEVLKEELHGKKEEKEEERTSLEDLESKLGDQKDVVETTKRNKNYLLTETKSEESAYQKLLKEKEAAKEAFEEELSEYESQLRIIIDQSRLPALGSGVLGWPLKDISLDSCYDGSTTAGNCVTQYFGDTAFA